LSGNNVRVEVSKTEDLTTGSYVFTFSGTAVGAVYAVMDKVKGMYLPTPTPKAILFKDVQKIADDKIEVFIDILQNPVPVLVVVLALTAVVGLLALLSLDKIEKIVTEPLPNIALILITIAVIIFLVRR